MSLLQWVSDRLHGVFGFSDKVVAEFVLQSARSAGTPNALLRSLTAADTLPDTAASYVAGR